MLKKLKLYNFQAHRKFELKFDPHVTTIVGATDSGKSSLIRALGFIALNDLSGDEFIRHGSAGATVLLWIDKHLIKRRRGKDGNTYELDGEEFRAFGMKNVPDKIAKILNVSTVNFQKQLDAHFWFSDTAGQVSRNLNQIINLGVIDDTLASVAAEVRKAQSTFEVCQERHSEFKNKVEALHFVPLMNVEHVRLREIEEAVEKAAGKATSLAFLVGAVAKHTKSQEQLKEAVTSGKEMVAAGEALKATARQASELGQLIKSIDRAGRITETTVPDISSLAAFRVKADRCAEKRRNLEHMIAEITQLEDERWQLQKKLERAEKTLRRITPRRCPKCGQVIPSLPSGSATSTSPNDRQCSAHRSQIGIRLRPAN